MDINRECSLAKVYDVMWWKTRQEGEPPPVINQSLHQHIHHRSQFHQFHKNWPILSRPGPTKIPKNSRHAYIRPWGSWPADHNLASFSMNNPRWLWFLISFADDPPLRTRNSCTGCTRTFGTPVCDADFQNAPMSVNTYKARTEHAQKFVYIYTYIYIFIHVWTVYKSYCKLCKATLCLLLSQNHLWWKPIDSKFHLHHPVPNCTSAWVVEKEVKAWLCPFAAPVPIPNIFP